MKQFSLYDILGVLAPGAVLTIGLVTLYPDCLKSIPAKDFSFGDLGILVIVSYVAGNLVAALGNILETPYWKLSGGRHTEQARHKDSHVMNSRQRKAVEEKLHEVGFLKSEEKITGLAHCDWSGIARQIYVFLHARKLTQRIDTFNAQYGMNRGIAAGFIALMVLEAFHEGSKSLNAEIILLICTILAIYRMQRFSYYYAAELFRQFIVCPKEGQITDSQKDSEE